LSFCVTSLSTQIFAILSEAFAHLANGEFEGPAIAFACAVAIAFAFAVPVLFHPSQKTVISTEAAHAFVSSAAEKSASLPPPFANPHTAYLPVPSPSYLIPAGDLLSSLYFNPVTSQEEHTLKGVPKTQLPPGRAHL
jgi:hypothetical protein